MLTVAEFEAAEVFERRFEPAEKRIQLEPEAVMLVHGLVDDTETLAACASWAIHQYEESGHKGTLLPDKLPPAEVDDSVRRVIAVQRRLMLCLTALTPKRYVTQVNVSAPKSRVGEHKDGRDNLTCATTLTGESVMEILNERKRKVGEVPFAPDITVVMHNGDQGVGHRTRNHTGDVRVTAVQRGYFNP